MLTTCALLNPPFLCAPCQPLQDGKEVQDKIMGYKLAPLSEAFAKLDKL